MTSLPPINDGLARAPRAWRTLPAPRGLPWLGHLLSVRPARFHQQLVSWAGALGTPYRLQLANMPVLVWDDVELAQQMLRDRPGGFARGGRIAAVAAEIGFDGVFAAEGQAWTRQRPLVMQALLPTRMRGFFPLLHATTERLYRRWARAAAAGETVEMGDDLMRYTVDVTSALSFGVDPNTLEVGQDRIQQHLAAIFPVFMQRILSPFTRWHWLPLPADRRLKRALTAVQHHIDGLIVGARTWRHGHPQASPRNLLDSFLDEADRPGSGISDATVRANVLTMLLAGEDTTAHALAWTMYYLAQHPHLQQELHEQAMAVLGAAEVCPDLDKLRALDLFEAAVTEALRLRPVAPVQFFAPLADTVIGGVQVPRGMTMFFINAPALHDPRHFHQPERYEPKRWLRTHGEGAHETRAFLQFGAGPRVCPGRHLAGLEMRLVLSMALKHFRIELAQPADRVREVLALTMGPARLGVRLLARPCSGKA
jgi:cytochrome P450